MIFYITTLLAYVNYAASRDFGRMSRQGPTISNSLVNLGKMDISFYIGKPSDLPSRKPDFTNILQALEQPKPQRELAPCPCSQFRNKMDYMIPKSSEIINSLLTNNALFRNPFSTTCCDSHEQLHDENTFVIDLTAKEFQNRPVRLPMVPEKATVKPQPLPNGLEIFLFPKRKDLASMDFMRQSAVMFRKPVQKDEIKKVGKDVSSIQALNEGAPIKKEIEKKIVLEEDFKTQKVEELTTPSNSL